MSILRKDLRGRCEHYRSEGSLSNWLRTCPHKGVVENLDFRVTKLKNVKDLCVHNLFLYHLNGQTDLFTIWTNNKQRISFTSCTNQSHLPQKPETAIKSGSELMEYEFPLEAFAPGKQDYLSRRYSATPRNLSLERPRIKCLFTL